MFSYKPLQIPFRTAILLIFIIAPITSTAQQNTFRHLTTRDGLTAGYIEHIMQDSNGFIWFGTSNGLNRYDGYEMSSYRPDIVEPTSITGTRVLMIREINSNQLLVGTNGGLNLMNPATEEFKLLKLAGDAPQINYVADIEIMSNGDLWIAADYTIFHIPKQDFEAEFLQASYFPLPEIEREGPREFFRNMAYNGNGLLVAGTTRRAFTLNIESDEPDYTEVIPEDEYTAEILSSAIWDVTADENGTIYISSIAGLAKWDVGNEEPQAITEIGDMNREEIESAGFQSVEVDSNGNLWLGTGLSGAIKWNPETDDITTFLHNPNNSNSIRPQNNDVHVVFADSQENVWFGYHFLGASVAYSNSWNYTYSLAIPEFEMDHPANELFMMYEDEEENLWFPTRNGLVFNSAESDSSAVFQPDADITALDGFSTMIPVDDQFLIFTGDGNKLFRFDPETKELRDVTVGDSLGVAPFTFVENDTHLFVSTFNRDIVKIDKRTYETERISIPVSFEDSEQGNPVIIDEDVDGNVFVIVLDTSSLTNLYWESFILDLGDLSFNKVDIELPENVSMLSLPHVSKYQSGVVWMRIDDGIFSQNMLTGESSHLFRSDFGVIGEGPGFINEDEEGFLWMANETGVMRLDPVTESIDYYEPESNRKPIIFNLNYKMSNGDFLFTGTGGYIRFNPNEIILEEPIQHIHIKELSGGGKLYRPFNSADLENLFEFESSENNITITFLGINYRDPLFTRYRYRIEGHDEDWVSVGTQRRVFLANLSPGDYTLRVQAAPQFGSYSDVTAEAGFSVLPPFWRTMPAYIFYLLLFVIGIFSVDRFQRRRLVQQERERAREKELEQAREIEKAYENLKEAQQQLVQQEKLASLGQLTAGIAHEIKNPLNFVNNFSELSVELIEEAREEVIKQKADVKSQKSPIEGGSERSEQGDDAISANDETPSLILDILNDIEANLRKIHEHGTRADSIVKSMLEHSRGGSGKMEPTDLNAMVKEFVNLSFHGMRASKNPINVDIELDLDESINEVSMIAEDFSRVIINLCNNSFDAMRDKLGLDTLQNYNPKLTIRTKSNNGKVIIEIEDNGPGIPEEIKNKILQPFFTTKRGTEGTGLGLSITNDIIKAHGGEMTIESESGKWTRFTIILNQ
jgi:signal transduction histidine kinase/streptogramin lyase